MKRPLTRTRQTRIVCTALLICASLLFCGLTAFATDGFVLDIVQATTPPIINLPLPPLPEDITRAELYPTDVQTIIEGDSRQIVKTYVLTASQSPADIPRDSFIRDGWQYTMTDITEKRHSETVTRIHTETAEINTKTNDLNDIVALLAATLDYQGEDGYCGVLTLDLSSVNCEVEGYRSSSYTASATREYPHLSAADTSLIPKTITDNGKTLTLDSVSWEVQQYVNIDHEDIPDSYRAVAKYSAAIPTSVVTGYVTTADYTGEVSKTLAGDTVYTVYFEGVDINPAPPEPTITPEPIEEPEPTVEPETPTKESGGSFPLLPVLIALAILASLAGAAAYFMLRRNVKVYRDCFRILVAKDKISVKNPVVDLSPLEGGCFGIEIDKFAAKALNGHAVEIKHGTAVFKHVIAYEGNAYRIEADFGAGTVQAIY